MAHLQSHQPVQFQMHGQPQLQVQTQSHPQPQVQPQPHQLQPQLQSHQFALQQQQFIQWQQQQQHQHHQQQHQILHQHQPNLHYPQQQQMRSPNHLHQRAPLGAPPSMLQQDPRYYMSPGYAGPALPSDGAPHHQPTGQMGMYPPHALNANVQGLFLFTMQNLFLLLL